mmetsp:Transcript_13001/g.26368  ORF Transcript_13001/g.26368 Transcript_13001/m.26368 type:complete len:297 (-) Transcript_13001:658-1548(-)
MEKKEGVERWTKRGFEPVRVCQAENAPRYLLREYISGHYRVGGDYGSALAGLFMMHNETLNAWTMIWGAMMSTTMLLETKAAYGGSWDHLPCQFWALWVAAVIHAPFSIMLHLCLGISEDVRKLWRTLDVFFIQSNSCLLAFGVARGAFGDGLALWGFMTVVVAMFVQSVYFTMVVNRIWKLSKRQLAYQMRNLVFAYLFPMVWQGLIDVKRRQEISPALLCAASAGTCLVLGGIVYGLHLPERWAPGRFDLVGNSHQIMHVLAYTAHYFEWLFALHLAGRHFTPADGVFQKYYPF